MSDDLNREEVITLYQDLHQGEQHFNRIQADYRRMASLWLLAVFSGVGFILTKPLTFDISPWVLVAGVSGAGTIGLLLIWGLDILVYHRLLSCYFSQALDLEQRYRFLPQIRQAMLKSQNMGQQGALPRLALFYSLPIALLFSSTLGSLFWALDWVSTPLENLVGIGLALGSGALVLYCIQRFSRLKA